MKKILLEMFVLCVCVFIMLFPTFRFFGELGLKIILCVLTFIVGLCFLGLAGTLGIFTNFKYKKEKNNENKDK